MTNGMKIVRKIWTKEEEELLKKMYSNNNFIIKDLYKTFNVKEYVLYRKLDSLNIPRKPKLTINDNYFSSMDTHEKWYIFGLLSADGCLENKKRVGLVLQEGDLEVIEFVKKELNFSGNIFKRKGTLRESGNTSQDQYGLKFTSSKICKDLIKNGLSERKSLILKFNQNCPDEFLNSYLLGYFDGDGCISSRNFGGNFNILGTKDVVENFVKRLKVLIGVSQNTIFERNQNNNKNLIYSINYSSREDLVKLYLFLYRNGKFKMSRKFIKFNNILNSFNSIIPIEVQDYINFSVPISNKVISNIKIIRRKLKK